MNEPETPSSAEFSGTRYFLSCDWGTSSFRLKLAERKTGRAAAVLLTGDGAKKVHESWEGQKDSGQTDFFLFFLRQKITELEQKVSARLAGIPVIVSGMASSSIGIKQLPYSPLPQNLESPHFQHEIIPAGKSLPHDLLMISGVCSSNDVMRGEETQLIGIYDEYKLDNGYCILPGTHSKHLRIRGSRLVGFKTYMTGELFQILGTHSILRNSLSMPENDSRQVKDSDPENNSQNSKNRDSFYRGIDSALEGNLLNSLFAIRARGLLGKVSSRSGYDFLSGLLIGAELKDLLPSVPEKIIVAGEEVLQVYYSDALRYLKIPHTMDHSPEERTVRGHQILVNMLL